MIFIAGPCVIESAELLDTVAERLVAINRRLGTDILFKASFDKANRTSIRSFRGPGLEKGLRMLADVVIFPLFPMLCKLMAFYPPFHGYTHVDKVENYPRNL